MHVMAGSPIGALKHANAMALVVTSQHVMHSASLTPDMLHDTCLCASKQTMNASNTDQTSSSANQVPVTDCAAACSWQALALHTIIALHTATLQSSAIAHTCLHLLLAQQRAPLTPWTNTTCKP
jgi:hypothetical protein